MILEDYHVHTNFCDGKDAAEAIVKEAIKKGMKRIGFSGHSYTFFDESYCMSKSDTEKYIEEINALKVKYKDKIDVLCGIERDFYSDIDTSVFDYVISSVHYIKADGKYFPVDESARTLCDTVKNFFGNDPYRFAEEYFKTVSRCLEGIDADIIGHFDLLTKFNDREKIFDENNPRYVNAYKKAIDTLVSFDVPFEINTGAMSRGYRKTAYPSNDMLKYILKKGGRVILSSDSHSKDTLLYGFCEYEKIAESIGFKSFNL